MNILILFSKNLLNKFDNVAVSSASVALLFVTNAAFEENCSAISAQFRDFKKYSDQVFLCDLIMEFFDHKHGAMGNMSENEAQCAQYSMLMT